MASIPTTIVMVQYFPGTEEYIVYREGAEPELFRGGAAITDQDFYAYARECAANGWMCESSFHVATGRVGTGSSVVCKQIVYCKALAAGASARAALSGVKNVTAGAANAVASIMGGASASMKDSKVEQTNIVWVKWAPVIYELQVCAGRLPLPKTHRIHDLSEAPAGAVAFMKYCFANKYIAACRSYQRPVQEGRTQHMAVVTEYYFAFNKPHKDFQGASARAITAEDMASLGMDIR